MLPRFASEEMFRMDFTGDGFPVSAAAKEGTAPMILHSLHTEHDSFTMMMRD